MITIKHIKAHLPYKNCQLTFMLKKKNLNSQTKQSQVKLTQDFVDLDINCVIQIGQFQNCKQPLQLCAIAVTDKEKICVGVIDININQNIQLQQAALKGVIGQDGFVVYSIKNGSKSNSSVKNIEQDGRSSNIKQQSQKKNSGIRGFIKYKDSSPNSSFNENQLSFQSKSGSQSPFRKNKSSHNADITNNDEYYKLLDQLYHDILESQLFNQRAWNKIHQNQIFQLRYKQRIEALLGKNPK